MLCKKNCDTLEGDVSKKEVGTSFIALLLRSSLTQWQIDYEGRRSVTDLEGAQVWNKKRDSFQGKA